MANWTEPHGKTLTFHNSGIKVTDESWEKIFKGLDKKRSGRYSKSNGRHSVQKRSGPKRH